MTLQCTSLQIILHMMSPEEFFTCYFAHHTLHLLLCTFGFAPLTLHLLLCTSYYAPFALHSHVRLTRRCAILCRAVLCRNGKVYWRASPRECLLCSIWYCSVLFIQRYQSVDRGSASRRASFVQRDCRGMCPVMSQIWFQGFASDWHSLWRTCCLHSDGPSAFTVTGFLPSLWRTCCLHFDGPSAFTFTGSLPSHWRALCLPLLWTLASSCFLYSEH